MTKQQRIGIGVVLLSLTVGTLGTAVSMYLSFLKLETAEFGGIGPVSDQIRNALLFSVTGVVGSIVGALLLIFGGAKPVTSSRASATGNGD